MNEKLGNYLDGVFSPYEDLHTVRELKEELLNDLQERLLDLKNQGHDDETAFRMTIESIGDIDEVIGSIADKTRELRQMTKRDLSMTNLQNSDLKGIIVHDGKFDHSALMGSDFSGSDLTNSSFNSSALKGSDFSGSNLTNGTFKSSDLRDVVFDGADLTGAKITTCALKGATFKNSVLNNTDFSSSDLSGVSFDNQTLNGTIFDKTGLAGTSFRNAVLRNVSFRNPAKKSIRQAIFDGATMDKLTYAVLKGNQANLTNVTVV